MGSLGGYSDTFEKTSKLFEYFRRGGSLYFLPYLFIFLLSYFPTYLLVPEQVLSLSRPEIVGGDQTWL